MEIRNAIANWIATEDRNYTDAVVEAILQNSESHESRSQENVRYRVCRNLARANLEHGGY